MVELVIIGFVAGIACGISPCILPVLPVIFVAGATAPKVGAGDRAGRTATSATVGVAGPASPGASTQGRVATLRATRADKANPAPTTRSRWRPPARPVSVVAGLVVSFSLVILAGSEIISALGLPQAFLRDAGIALLVVVGVELPLPAPVDPARAAVRPDQRYGSQTAKRAGSWSVWLSAWCSCRAPVRSSAPSPWPEPNTTVGWTAVFLTVAFGLGVAIPLLVGGRRRRSAHPADRDPAPPRPPGPPGQRGGRPRHGPRHRAEHLLRPAKGPARLHHRGPDREQVRKQLATVEGENQAPKAGAGRSGQVQLHGHQPSSTAAWPRTSPGSPPG